MLTKDLLLYGVQMSGALAAFFGVPLGGSLFALEVCSRFGMEYYEHALEAILAGEVCLAVFRSVSGLPIHSIWTISESKLPSTDATQILYGAVLGLIGAAIAFLFGKFHFAVVGQFSRWNLLSDCSNAVQRAWLGATVVVGVGLLIPQTLFWGEFEFQTIATMSPVASLPRVYPARSLVNFEMNSCITALMVGVAKLIAISFTVAGGYRGGYIFPLFSSAAAFGCALHFIVPFVPLQLCVLCMAASVNVAVTRTAIGSTLILAYLSGEPNAISAILAASLVSVLFTAYMPPFIPTQTPRVDLEQSLYQNNSMDLTLSKGLNTDGDSQTGETEALTPFSDVHKHIFDDE
jgi:H+/Cl- antiporter ClcA